VTVLAGELLREAEKLINLRIHPMVIIDGWRRATAVARAALEASALDHGADPVAFREDLLNIARTTLSSKLLTHEKDQFGEREAGAEKGARDAGLPSPSPPSPRLTPPLPSLPPLPPRAPAANLAVDAVLRIRGTLNLEQIQIIKRSGGSLKVRGEGGGGKESLTLPAGRAQIHLHWQQRAQALPCDWRALLALSPTHTHIG
jgi:T-complex protein 1 subunit beta